MQLSNSNTQSRTTIIALIAIAILSILVRTVPALHLWPNFSPIGALALFSGALFWNKKWMFVIPVGAMSASDTIKEITAPGTGFYPDMVYVYASFFAIILLGMIIKNTKRPLSILGASIAGSVLFFLVTNFGAWMMNNPTSFIIYTRNFSGLIACYASGIPFFKYTLFSDLLFNGVFFGGYYLLSANSSVKTTVA